MYGLTHTHTHTHTRLLLAFLHRCSWETEVHAIGGPSAHAACRHQTGSGPGYPRWCGRDPGSWVTDEGPRHDPQPVQHGVCQQHCPGTHQEVRLLSVYEGVKTVFELKRRCVGFEDFSLWQLFAFFFIVSLFCKQKCINEINLKDPVIT